MLMGFTNGWSRNSTDNTHIAWAPAQDSVNGRQTQKTKKNSNLRKIHVIISDIYCSIPWCCIIWFSMEALMSICGCCCLCAVHAGVFITLVLRLHSRYFGFCCCCCCCIPRSPFNPIQQCFSLIHFIHSLLDVYVYIRIYRHLLHIASSLCTSVMYANEITLEKPFINVNSKPSCIFF